MAAKLGPRGRSIRGLSFVLTIGVLALLLGNAGGGLVKTAHTNASMPAHPPLSAPVSVTGKAQTQSAYASLGLSSTTGRPAAATTGWNQVTAPVPGERYGASATYDALDKHYVLFGGQSPSGNLNDTWELSLTKVWTPLTPAISPPTRVDASMAYDATDKYVVLFGGVGQFNLLSDTWTFAGGKWTQLHPTVHPPALWSAAMTFDAATGYVLLFGGNNSTGKVQSGTWEFKGGVWTQLTPTHIPTARMGAALDYDAADKYPVMFGGLPANGVSLGDTWNFTGTDWHQLSPTVSPAARAWAGIGYSPADGKVVLSGGTLNRNTASFAGDTWLFSGGVWTKKATFVRPSNRGYTASADGVSATSGVLIFGGVSFKFLDDAWMYEKGAWQKVIPVLPSARIYPVMTWDEHDGFVLMYGGYNYSGSKFLSDTWKFLGGVWTPIFPSTNPGPLEAATMAYDQADGYVLMFGGTNGYGDVCTTWAFQKSSWTEVVDCGASPPGRVQAAMTYDAWDGSILLYGGVNASNVLSDTWTYSAGTWNQLSPSGTPPAGYGAAMSYDSADGYVMMFGGFNLTGVTSNQTWVYENGSWQNVTPAFGNVVLALGDAAAIDDTLDGYVLLFGGWNPTFGAMDFSYAFSSFRWSFVTSGSPPPTMYAQGMAYDPTDGYAVLFGGFSGSFSALSQTWTYAG